MMFLAELNVARIHEATIAGVDHYGLRLIRYTFWPTSWIINRIELVAALGISFLDLQCSIALLLSLLSFIETLLF